MPYIDLGNKTLEDAKKMFQYGPSAILRVLAELHGPFTDLLNEEYPEIPYSIIRDTSSLPKIYFGVLLPTPIRNYLFTVKNIFEQELYDHCSDQSTFPQRDMACYKEALSSLWKRDEFEMMCCLRGISKYKMSSLKAVMNKMQEWEEEYRYRGRLIPLEGIFD